MNVLIIIFAYLQKRWLHTLLSIILLAFGVAVIVFLLLIQPQMEQHFWKNTQGIKMVVGAKGSPLQLVLSNIYHTANPTGNIALSEAKKIQNKVQKSIPLVLGDNFEGYKIVGTTIDYPQHYQAKIKNGRLWEKSLEAVVGADVAKNLSLKIGQKIVGGHGGHKHEDKKYTIVGILNPNYSVVDKLVLTDLKSIWEIHEENNQNKNETHTHAEGEEHHEDENREITALLITKLKNQMQALNLPRFINKETNMMAAQPVIEIQTLFDSLGIGEKVLQILAWVIVMMAILSIFIALFDSLKNRKYDLALMRSLGASKQQIFMQVVLQGFILVFFGNILGILLGHLLTEWVGSLSQISEQMYITGFFWINTELYIILFSIPLAMLTAFIPAYQAYQTQTAKVLSA
ncbi:MAG: FtsX-like permease family protein [Bacteroidetes bacterium]|nr:MAG: FtsX-like permease family protein [Bacteroidota bacterium]